EKLHERVVYEILRSLPAVAHRHAEAQEAAAVALVQLPGRRPVAALQPGDELSVFGSQRGHQRQGLRAKLMPYIGAGGGKSSVWPTRGPLRTRFSSCVTAECRNNGALHVDRPRYPVARRARIANPERGLRLPGVSGPAGSGR